MRPLIPAVLLFTLAVLPAAAAVRSYDVDPGSGRVEVTVGPETAPSPPPPPPARPACERERAEIEKLREVVRQQQSTLREQQRRIDQLREDLRRQERINLGLDQLRRQGR
jgi:TolA-binding protein